MFNMRSLLIDTLILIPYGSTPKTQKISKTIYRYFSLFLWIDSSNIFPLSEGSKGLGPEAMV